MQSLMESWRRLLGMIAAVERLVLALLVTTIVATISAQVVSRYFFNLPITWVEEVATYSFIWGTFVGAAVALKYDRHVKIETFIRRLPARGEAFMRLVVFALILVFIVWLLPKAWANMTLEMRRTTIALPVRIPMGWFFSVPLIYGMVSMAFTAAYRILAELAVMLGGPPTRPIDGNLVEAEEDIEVERVLTGESDGRPLEGRA